MTMGRISRVGVAWVAATWLSGCGPLVSLEDETDTEADSGDATTAPPPSTSTTSPPGTTSPPLPPPDTTTSPPGEESTSGGPVMTSSVFLDGGLDFQQPGDECDLWQQDCPRGEKCMPWANDGGSSWNATRCSPIDEDPDAPGESCTVEGSGTSGIDSCELGSMCWSVDEDTLEGHCVAFCVGSPENPVCEAPSTICAQSSDSVLSLCLPTCDPLQQDCPAGDACYPIQDYWSCAPDASGEAGGYGDACEFINVCNPGYVCLNSATVPPGEPCEGAVGCCTAICNLADPLGDAQCEGAAGGQTCQPWYEEGTAPPGYALVGVCALPM
jgi:hypothetical protein